MISITDVSRIYGTGGKAFKALDTVSVEIAENEFFTLLDIAGLPPFKNLS